MPRRNGPIKPVAIDLSDPGSRQQGESDQAWEAFVIYRDMVPRRYFTATAKQLGKNPSLIEYWAKRWSWVARCSAWDEAQDRAKRQKILEGMAAMAERHVRIAMGMQQKLVERLQSIRPEELSAAQVAHWFEVAVHIERQARGLPEDYQQQDEADAGIALDDPNTIEAAAVLVERLAAGKVQPGGAGAGGEPRPLGLRPPSGDHQPGAAGAGEPQAPAALD